MSHSKKNYETCKRNILITNHLIFWKCVIRKCEYCQWNTEITSFHLITYWITSKFISGQKVRQTQYLLTLLCSESDTSEAQTSPRAQLIRSVTNENLLSYRDRIVQEILSTGNQHEKYYPLILLIERAYIKKLQLLIQHFLVPLRKDSRQLGTFQRIFTCWEFL